jgi:hypothetical protein
VEGASGLIFIPANILASGYANIGGPFFNTRKLNPVREKRR